MVALLLVAASGAGAQSSRRWGVEVGHSYSSAKALHQPATFALSVGSSVTTDIQAGVLAGGPIWPGASLEIGLRTLTGSTRTKAEREYGAMVRGYTLIGEWVNALSGEYEADGGFDVQKGVIAAEVSPLGEMRWCLGVRCARSRLQWRPWLGVGVGNSFRGERALAEPEGHAFLRVYLRGEVSWLPRENLELILESTGWYLARGSRGRTNTTASLSYEVWKGFSLTAKGQVGCAPPRFGYERALSVGVGFVRRREREGR